MKIHPAMQSDSQYTIQRVPAYELATDDGTEEQGIDLVHYWRTVRRYKWGILGIALVCVMIGILNAYSATPIYKAETKLLVSPIQQSSPLDQQTNTALIYLFYETQYEIIRSRAVAGLAVDNLKLVSRYQGSLDKVEAEMEAAGELTDDNIQSLEGLSEALRSFRANFDWQDWLPRDWLPEAGPEPDAVALRNHFIEEIREPLGVKGGKQSEIINISYQSSDPKQAAAVANAIADAYINFGLASRLSGARQTSGWLNTQLNELKAKVKESEMTLQAYQQQSGLVDSGNQQKLASERLSSLTAELIRTQTRRSEAQIRYSQVSGLKGNATGVQSLGEVLENPSVRALSEEVNTLGRKVYELAERYGDKHPRLIAAGSDFREARRSLQIEVDKMVESIRKEYSAALSQEKKIQALIEQQKKDIGDLGGAGFELAQLEREVENNRSMYQSFLEKFKEADVAEEYDASNVRVVDRAIAPTTAFKPNKKRAVLIAAFLGLLLGLLVALLRERLDNTFKTTDHVEEKLGIPALGIVPLVAKSGKAGTPERQVINNQRSSFAENINNIRTGLLFSNIDKPPRTILVTSATGDEGKTTLSVNLAAAFSQLGSTVLVEVDLRKSNIATRLDIESQPGLTDVITGEIPLKECMRQLEADKLLYVLPCGSVPPNPLELLSSQKFHQTLGKLQEQFTYVVLDAPPMLAVSDATVLGHLADSVILAIKAESTTHKMAGETLARLSKTGVKVTGGVLCQTDTRRMARYGSHYYHYDANYYGYSAKKGSAT